MLPLVHRQGAEASSALVCKCGLRDAQEGGQGGWAGLTQGPLRGIGLYYLVKSIGKVKCNHLLENNHFSAFLCRKLWPGWEGLESGEVRGHSSKGDSKL